MKNNNQENQKNSTFEQMLKYYLTYKIIGSIFSKPRPQQVYKKNRGMNFIAFIFILIVFFKLMV